MKIIEIMGPWDGDGFASSYYTVATDSKHEIVKIKQRGEQLGFEVQVREADTFDGVWRFFDTFSGKR